MVSVSRVIKTAMLEGNVHGIDVIFFKKKSEFWRKKLTQSDFRKTEDENKQSRANFGPIRMIRSTFQIERIAWNGYKND
jgi:hypothetical protein